MLPDLIDTRQDCVSNGNQRKFIGQGIKADNLNNKKMNEIYEKNVIM